MKLSVRWIWFVFLGIYNFMEDKFCIVFFINFFVWKNMHAKEDEVTHKEHRTSQVKLYYLVAS